MFCRLGAVSSVVERLVYTEDVGSSTLSSPTISSFLFFISCQQRQEALTAHAPAKLLAELAVASFGWLST